ncbi:MAG: ribosome biogenesis GTPase Der [Actinobacteria bacterium]|nr:ribosome biogenesis GTPase Der [Actinomycetota bacterium]
MTHPSVAVVGRQNVGKSTLVNRLFGRREAIAHEMPGVTRDRVELEATWRDRSFRLVDTGGFHHGSKGIEELVSRQAERAASTADVVLLIVDARTGPVEEDGLLASKLRRARMPVLVVANKVDSEADEVDVAAFHSLGLGEPIAVSALHGRGAGDLLDRIVAVLPQAQGELEDEAREPRFAIVGRPNVGKSSLFNRLVGDERSVVFEEAGTTRDAVDAVVGWPEGAVRFVDTAGFRRPSKARGVEYYSFLRADRAIELAHVAVLVLDAAEGFAGEDKRIAARVIEHGRGLVVVANKWDLVGEKDPTFKELVRSLLTYARAPVLRTSAKSGQGLDRIPAVLRRVNERWRLRVPTARVNEVVEHAQMEQHAPGRVRYRYATQTGEGPPRFVLFGAGAPDAGYRRFLEGRLRTAFELEGVPIDLSFRRGRSSRRR